MANCPMYLTTGSCRLGDYCMQYHNRPTISPTLLLSNMYQRLDKITPGIDAQGNPIDPNQIQEHYFEYFYKDIFKQLSKYGEIMCLHVCDNLAHHMAGNVYVQFRHEKHAEDALKDLQGMLYNNGRPIRVDYSPVTNFYHATCNLFEKNRCKRGSKCNFLHVKKIRHELMQELYARSWRSWYSRSQSRNPSCRRDRESRKRSHERGDHRDRDQERHERLRYSRSRSRSRSRSPSFRRGRERSHERGDHRDRDRKRHERLRYNQSWSRSRSPSYRRDRERSHERGDLRDRDGVRHEMRYERMSRRSRYRRSQSRSRSPSYRRYSRERSHERGVQRRSSERDRDRERHERRS